MTLKKYSICLSITIVTLVMHSVQVQAKIAIISGLVHDNSSKKLASKKVYYAQHKYKRGGITFYYPAGTFTEEPIVHCSLVQNGTKAWKPERSFVAIVTDNNALASTVRVTKIHNKKTSEAGDNQVTVSLWAVER